MGQRRQRRGVCRSSIPPACSRNSRTVPWRLHAMVWLAGFLSFNAFPSPRVRLPVGSDVVLMSKAISVTSRLCRTGLVAATEDDAKRHRPASHLSPTATHRPPLTGLNRWRGFESPQVKARVPPPEFEHAVILACLPAKSAPFADQ